MTSMTNSPASFFSQTAADIFYFPQLRRGIFAVWLRNFLFFRYTLTATLAWIFLEPILYVVAFGYGLGHFIAHINGMSYVQFVAPAMMATSGMLVAYLEGTYGTFMKLTRQNTYSTIILTPVSSDEVAVAEILWCASKAAIGVVAVAIVLVAFGILPVGNVLPALGVLFLLCWVFAALGVWLACMSTSFEWFIYFQSGLIIPMSLFCGTFFPLSRLPHSVYNLVLLLPLTHAMQSVRMFLAGDFRAQFFINIMYLILLGIAFTNLAAARLRRRLIT